MKPRGRARRRSGGEGVLVLAAGLLVLWLLAEHPSVLDSAAATAAADVDTDTGGSVADIPAGHLALYRQAGGTCAGLDWALLAGVGKVETDHGRSPLPGVRSGTNSAGAAGPMQFLAPTFREVRGNHPEVGPNVYDPAHAIPAAAHYLCDGGLIDGRGVRAALWTYNHSRPYANEVLDHADRYRAAAGGGS